MKYLSILTVLLILIIAIAQAIPMQTENLNKREVGSKVKPLGVRFEGYYAKFNSQVNHVNDKFYKKIAAFNEQIPKAAAEDGTDKEDLTWLLNWNAKYKSLVDELDTTSKKLEESIANLGKKLGS